MPKILAFGASNSRQSINKQFAHWAATQFGGAELVLLDLNDFDLPTFSVERESEDGIPQLALDFREILRAADGIIISFAEHNGSFSAAFKNIYDWISRSGNPIWLNKSALLLATSPGGRGGTSVLGHALDILPHRGVDIAGSFSLPFFQKNFSETSGITDAELLGSFNAQMAAFRNAVQKND